MKKTANPPTSGKTPFIIHHPMLGWLAIAGVVIALFCLVLAGGGGLTVILGRQGIGPLAGLATRTSAPTKTSTATPTKTSTPTIPSPTGTPIPTNTLASFSPPTIVYTVQAGDTCVSIALLFGISVQSIITLNNLDANCTIFPGQNLIIPQPAPTPSREPCQTVSYIVQEGDTLQSIALNFGVEMDAIKEWNGLVSDVLYVGQVLIIPLCPTPAPSLMYILKTSLL